MAYIPTVDEFNSSAQFKVAEWSRNTVADGVWLQKNTMRPLKERDDFILSLLKDLGNTDSWKQWSENHGSTSDPNYPDASAIYIGPNNNILGSGHAYVIGENNQVVATDHETSYSRGGSYVFGMDNYVNDAFVIGNQVTANMGSKVIGRDVSATRCSTVIGYNVSADEGSLALTTPTDDESKKIVTGGSLLISIANCNKPVISETGSINVSRGNASALRGGILIGGDDAYVHGSLGFGRTITASAGGTIIGYNGKAVDGGIIIKNGGSSDGNYSYAEQYGIVIGNAASAKHGALAISINNDGNIYSEHGGIAIGMNASAEFGAIAINGYGSTHSYATKNGLVLNPGENHNSYAANLGFVFGGGSAEYCAAIIGDNNSATNCAFAFGDKNTVKANFAFGLNNSAVASTLTNYYILSAERVRDIWYGTETIVAKTFSSYEPHGFIVGDNNISQTYSPIIIGVANSASLSGGFGELANYDTTGYKTPNYPIAIGIGNKAYRNFDTTIGSYNAADGGSNLIFGDWCSAIGTRNTILNGYDSSIMGMENLIYGSKSKIFIHDKDNNPSTIKDAFERTSRNILYWSTISALTPPGVSVTATPNTFVTDNILKNSNIKFSPYYAATNSFSENKVTYADINVSHSGETFFTYNDITGSTINLETNHYIMFNFNKIRLGYKNNENTLNINGKTEFITNNNIDYRGTGKTFNVNAWTVNHNDFKYNRSIPIDPATNILNINIPTSYYNAVVENNIYQSIFDINLTNNDNSTYVNNNNLLFTKYICDSNKLKQYIMPNYSEHEWDSEIYDYTAKIHYNYVFGNSFVFGGSILNSDRVISFATECSLTGGNNEYTTISNSKNIINLGDDNEISASMETVSFGKMNNIVGGHKTTIFGNENIAYITPYDVSELIIDAESYRAYSGITDKLPGLYDTNIIGSYNSFMSDIEFDPNEDKHANTIAHNFILGYYNDIKVHNFITDNVIIGNNNKTVYEPDNYSDQLYRNKIIGNNNSASNQFADCNILGDNNELNNDSGIVFENDTIIGMHNKVEFGSNSTLIGHHNIVSGYNSVLIGEGLSATNSQVVVGRFNALCEGTDDREDHSPNSGVLFIVGNGSHTEPSDYTEANVLASYEETNIQRSNAMIVSADGTVSARTYKADPTSPLGKLFDFLTTATLGNGALHWNASTSAWSIQ